VGGGKRREGEERGKSKYNGEIEEGRRHTVHNFAHPARHS
jgi:hypothetical protein